MIAWRRLRPLPTKSPTNSYPNHRQHHRRPADVNSEVKTSVDQLIFLSAHSANPVSKPRRQGSPKRLSHLLIGRNCRSNNGAPIPNRNAPTSLAKNLWISAVIRQLIKRCRGCISDMICRGHDNVSLLSAIWYRCLSRLTIYEVTDDTRFGVCCYTQGFIGTIKR